MTTITKTFIAEHIKNQNLNFTYDIKKFTDAINQTIKGLNSTVNKNRIAFNSLDDEEGIIVNDYYGMYAEKNINPHELFSFLIGEKKFIRGLPNLSSFAYDNSDAKALKLAFEETYNSL